MPSVTTLDADQVRALASVALAAGAERTGATRVEWDVSSGCLDPVHLDIFGRPLDMCGKSRHTWRVFMVVKCRRCPHCMRRRAFIWRERIKAEMRASSRTWFGTLTLSPEMHMRAHALAIRYSRQALCSDFEAETPAKQFRLRHAVISKWLTKWLKRVRKQSGVKLRYCLVAEAHKSGLPHYHCVIHQCHPEMRVKYTHLRGTYDLGFCKFNLVQSDDYGRSAAYVAKYLAKSAQARVRASIRYGSCEPTWRPEDIGPLAARAPPPPGNTGNRGPMDWSRAMESMHAAISPSGAVSGPEAVAAASGAASATAHATASGPEAGAAHSAAGSPWAIAGEAATVGTTGPPPAGPHPQHPPDLAAASAAPLTGGGAGASTGDQCWR